MITRRLFMKAVSVAVAMPSIPVPDVVAANITFGPRLTLLDLAKMRKVERIGDIAVCLSETNEMLKINWVSGRTHNII